jgi:hypothetical protein
MKIKKRLRSYKTKEALYLNRTTLLGLIATIKKIIK